jgi:hypothetical protein
MPHDVEGPRAPVVGIQRCASLVDQLEWSVVVTEQKAEHLLNETLVVRRVIGRNVEVAHHHPFHEDVSEVNGTEERVGALERAVLVALDVDLHDGLPKRNDANQIVQQDGFYCRRARAGTLAHLQRQYSVRVRFTPGRILSCTQSACQNF